jgi:hypothetical protein
MYKNSNKLRKIFAIISIILILAMVVTMIISFMI